MKNYYNKLLFELTVHVYFISTKLCEVINYIYSSTEFINFLYLLKHIEF